MMLLSIASSIFFGSFPVLFRAPSVPNTPIPLLICTTVTLSIVNIFFFPILVHFIYGSTDIPVAISLPRAIIGVSGAVGFLTASWYAIRHLGLSFAFPIVFGFTSFLATLSAIFGLGIMNEPNRDIVWDVPLLIAAMVLMVVSVAGILVCRYLPNAVWVPRQNNDDDDLHRRRTRTPRESYSDECREVFVINPELMRHGNYDVTATSMWKKITVGIGSCLIASCFLILVWSQFMHLCRDEMARHDGFNNTRDLSAHILHVYLMEQACIFLGFSVLSGIMTLIIKGILEKIQSTEVPDEEEPLLASDERESFTIEFTENLRAAFIPGIITGIFFGLSLFLSFCSILTVSNGTFPYGPTNSIFTVSINESSFLSTLSTILSKPHPHFSSSSLTWIYLHLSLLVSTMWGWFYLRDLTVRNELDVGYYVLEDTIDDGHGHESGNVFFPSKKSVKIGCGELGWRFLFSTCLCGLIVGDVLLVGWSWRFQ